MVEQENKIVIVSDDDKVIAYQDITIVNDTIDREDVARAKQEIAELEQIRNDADEKIVNLKAKILYAEKVIALADEEKAKVVAETATEENSVVEG